MLGQHARAPGLPDVGRLVRRGQQPAVDLVQFLNVAIDKHLATRLETGRQISLRLGDHGRPGDVWREAALVEAGHHVEFVAHVQRGEVARVGGELP